MPKLQGVYRAGNGSWYFKATLGRDPLSGKRVQVTKRGSPPRLTARVPAGSCLSRPTAAAVRRGRRCR
jgi:hypothetical protein